MINVVRPNIKKATTYLQQTLMETNKILRIKYLTFFPLYRKTYTEDKQTSIICDNDHHTKNDSIIGIHGLNNLNARIQIVQGIHIAICHLLLVIPCQGTSNEKLFQQIKGTQTMNGSSVASTQWIPQKYCFARIQTIKILQSSSPYQKR